MKAIGCVGDAFQGMTFRLQRCPVHHHGQYLLLHNSTPKSVQRCSQNKEGISAVDVDFGVYCVDILRI